MQAKLIAFCDTPVEAAAFMRRLPALLNMPEVEFDGWHDIERMQTDINEAGSMTPEGESRDDGPFVAIGQAGPDGEIVITVSRALTGD